MRPTRRLLAGALALGLLAAACGDDGGDGEATSTTAAATGAASTGASGTGASAATTTVKNTASDQGVTETEIKVAIVGADLTGLIKAGVIKGVPDNSFELNNKRFSYYADKVNASGGINGRKITYQAVSWDPADPKSFDTACQKIADGKFFLAFNVGGGYNPDKVPCITDAGTFFISPDPVGLGAFKAGGDKIITLAPPSEISAQTAAESLAKTLQKTDKIGMIIGNNPFQTDSYARVKKVFTAAGLNIVYDSPVNTATQTAGDIAKDVALLVPKMQAAGVNQVVLMLPFTQAGGFPGEADKSGLKVKYSLIEIASGGCTTFSASQMPAILEGLNCITHWDNHRYDANGKLQQDTKFEADCRTEYEEIYGFKTVPGSKFAGDVATGGTTKEDQSYFECALVKQVVIPALKAAGGNLTKKTFFDAAMKLGSFDVAGISDEKGSLGPDKPFVATAVQTVVLNVGTDTKGADGFYGKCPLLKTNCFRTQVPKTWTPITATLKS